MEKEGLESADFRILEILEEEGSLSSNEIWRETGAQRNRTLERIKCLIARKFLYVENGKKGLTEKGRLALLQNDLNGLRKILDRVKMLAQQLASEPDMLDELRETERRKVREFTGAKDLSLEALPARLEEIVMVGLPDEEKKQRELDIVNAYSGPFRRALRTMQQLSPSFARSPQTRALSDKELYTHVSENGVIDVLTEEEVDELLRRAPDIQSHTF